MKHEEYYERTRNDCIKNASVMSNNRGKMGGYATNYATKSKIKLDFG